MSKLLAPELFNKDDIEQWQKFLKDEGYVVIRNILTDSEYNKGLELFKQDIETVSPKFNFDDQSTWTIDTCPLMFGKGMAVFNGFGQSDFMWHLRTNQTIQSIFKQVYDTDELVTSMDGFSLFVSKDQKSKPWLHIDQNPKNKMYSIQGAYNYKPVASSDDAGFVLVPKSHKTYSPEVKTKGDWVVCDPQPIQESRKLFIPKNCLVLWNSRTIHANEGMTKKNKELNRLTCYIAFQPKHLRKPNYFEKRKQAYLNADATSHYANRCEIKRFPFGFKTKYMSRGFKQISPSLTATNEIPPERLELL